uniref:FH2 domain-containing protein n=1 Tax=Trichuris muris TaxID=70415 RepID=A0A5S6Q7C9_TRIMR
MTPNFSFISKSGNCSFTVESVWLFLLVWQYATIAWVRKIFNGCSIWAREFTEASRATTVGPARAASLKGGAATTLCVPPMLLLPWPEPIPTEIQWRYKDELTPVKATLNIVRSWNKTEDALLAKHRKMEQALVNKLIDPELLKSVVDLKKLSIMCNTLAKFSKAKAITEHAMQMAHEPLNPKDFDRLISFKSDHNLERIVCDFLGHLDSPADVLESLVELLVPELGDAAGAKRSQEAFSGLIGRLLNSKASSQAARRKK